MTNDDEVTKLLRDAADLIEPDGKWVQGGLAGDKNGRPLDGAVTGADFCGHCWCVVGAIDKAWWNARCVEKLDVSLRASNLAKSHLQTMLGMNPMYWNDLPGRTQEEAVSALRRAAQERIAA
jgi:hypothetical protein